MPSIGGGGVAKDSEQDALVPPPEPAQVQVYDDAPVTLFIDVPAVQLKCVAAQTPLTLAVVVQEPLLQLPPLGQQRLCASPL